MVISGLSGAGKSSAMNVFEDAGYFCVDNLPAEMIRSLSELFMHEGSKVELRGGRLRLARRRVPGRAGGRDRPAGGGGRRAPRRLPHRRRGGAGQPLQGDPPAPPARPARQRARRHPRRAGAARAGPPAGGHRDRHLGLERRRAAPQGRRRAARAGHAGPAGGHLHVVRPQARPAARRRPRVRRPLPAQPALRPRPAPADRLRPADRRLRRPRRAAAGLLLAPDPAAGVRAPAVRRRGQGAPDGRDRLHRRPAPHRWRSPSTWRSCSAIATEYFVEVAHRDVDRLPIRR